jgi:hypothetical protein
MKGFRVRDSDSPWLTTLSWPDKVIARCFPNFFRQYAPEEIQKQWAEHLARKQKAGKQHLQ